MNPVNVEGYFTVVKSRSTEVKPAFRVALSVCAFAIAGCPDRVLISVDSDSFTHVSTVEVAVQNHLPSVVVEPECVFMWNHRQFVLHASFKTVLYFGQFNFINTLPHINVDSPPPSENFHTSPNPLSFQGHYIFLTHLLTPSHRC